MVVGPATMPTLKPVSSSAASQERPPSRALSQPKTG